MTASHDFPEPNEAYAAATDLVGLARQLQGAPRPTPSGLSRLRDALDAYPQGHGTDEDGHLVVRVRADDLRTLLGAYNAERWTADREAAAEALEPFARIGRLVTAEEQRSGGIVGSAMAAQFRLAATAFARLRPAETAAADGAGGDPRPHSASDVGQT